MSYNYNFFLLSVRWSADKKWPFDAVVEFNNECFKGEGPQNVAIPCDSSQECFYVRNSITYMYCTCTCVAEYSFGPKFFQNLQK